MTEHNAQHEDIGTGKPAAVPPGETELWRGRTSWKHHADLLLAAAGWSVVALLLALRTPLWLDRALVGLTVLVWCYVAGRTLYAHLVCRYRLTNQRLFIERGVLGRTIDQTELIRIDDLRLHQSLLNRLLGLGSVQIVSSDDSDAELRIEGIEQPRELADLIREQIRRLREGSVYVERL